MSGLSGHPLHLQFWPKTHPAASCYLDRIGSDRSVQSKKPSAGICPFGIAFVKDDDTLVDACSFRWPRGSNLSKEVKELIQSLLKRNPQERPSAKQLLSHPWVRGSCSTPAHALLVAGKKLLEGAVIRDPEAQKEVGSPLVQQLLADTRHMPTVLPWPESPGILRLPSGCRESCRESREPMQVHE